MQLLLINMSSSEILVLLGKKKVLMTVILLLWCHVHYGAGEIDWGLYDKLKTLEKCVIQNENLSKFLTVPNKDNEKYDATKAKRSFDNDRCITDLQWMQANFDNSTNGEIFESKTKTTHLVRRLFPITMNDHLFLVASSV